MKKILVIGLLLAAIYVVSRPQKPQKKGIDYSAINGLDLTKDAFSL